MKTMARKTKKVEEVTAQKAYKKDYTKRSNTEIAQRVIAGEFGEDWQYAVRKMGYSVKAVGVLVYGYLKQCS